MEYTLIMEADDGALHTDDGDLLYQPDSELSFLEARLRHSFLKDNTCSGQSLLIPAGYRGFDACP